MLGEKLKPSLGVSCAGCETKVKAVARWREAERGPGKEEIEKGQTQATTSGTYHAELGASPEPEAEVANGEGDGDGDYYRKGRRTRQGRPRGLRQTGQARGKGGRKGGTKERHCLPA